MNKSRQQISYLQKFRSDAATSMKLNRVKLHDLSFVQRSQTEAFESLIASEHHLDGGAKVFCLVFWLWSSVRSMGVPMDGYSNLFLGVGTAVSLFLVVHHVGHSVIRYLNRCKNCIVKHKSKRAPRCRRRKYRNSGWRREGMHLCHNISVPFLIW